MPMHIQIWHSTLSDEDEGILSCTVECKRGSSIAVGCSCAEQCHAVHMLRSQYNAHIPILAKSSEKSTVLNADFSSVEETSWVSLASKAWSSSLGLSNIGGS